MAVLIALALVWVGMRSLLLLSQVTRHSPEAHLGRAFQAELEQRGLLGQPREMGIDS